MCIKTNKVQLVLRNFQFLCYCILPLRFTFVSIKIYYQCSCSICICNSEKVTWNFFCFSAILFTWAFFVFYCLDYFYTVHVNLICAKVISFVSESLGERPNCYKNLCHKWIRLYFDRLDYIFIKFNRAILMNMAMIK